MLYYISSEPRQGKNFGRLTRKNNSRWAAEIYVINYFLRSATFSSMRVSGPQKRSTAGIYIRSDGEWTP